MIPVSEISQEVGKELGSLWRPLAFDDVTQIASVNSAVSDLSKLYTLPANDDVISVTTTASPTPVSYDIPELIQTYWVKRNGVLQDEATMLLYKDYMKQNTKEGFCIRNDKFITVLDGTWDICANKYPALIKNLESGTIDAPYRLCKDYIVARTVYYYYLKNQKSQKVKEQAIVCAEYAASIGSAETNKYPEKKHISSSAIA